MSEIPFKSKIKIIVLGPKSSGKSSLCARYSKDKFSQKPETIGKINVRKFKLKEKCYLKNNFYQSIAFIDSKIIIGILFLIYLIIP